MIINKSDYFAFDFDGVIADSIHECMISGYNAYTQIKCSSKRKYDLKEFSESDISEFRRLRNFIRSGEDYVYIMLSFDLGISIKTQQDWDNFVAENVHHKEKYYVSFYDSRRYILDNFRDKWLSLNPLYPSLKNVLSQIPIEHIFIVTTKDIHFVKEILYANGIILKNEHLFQAVKSVKKPDIIRKILSDYKLTKEKLNFIDDHAQTVIDVSITGIRCYLASWGYNTLEQQKKLKNLEIPILGLDDLVLL